MYKPCLFNIYISRKLIYPIFTIISYNKYPPLLIISPIPVFCKNICIIYPNQFLGLPVRYLWWLKKKKMFTLYLRRCKPIFICIFNTVISFAAIFHSNNRKFKPALVFYPIFVKNPSVSSIFSTENRILKNFSNEEKN